MGLFGSLFGNQQSQGQPAPAAPAAPPPDQNPYIPLTHTGALGQWLGVPKALQQHAAAVAAAQAWQLQHDYANQTGQFAPPQSGSTAPMTVSDGATTTAPVGGMGYTSSPGPMDAIAAQAQGAPPPPTQGGTSLLNTGPAPSMPSYEAMGLPRTAAQQEMDQRQQMAKLVAAGVPVDAAQKLFDLANESNNWTDLNGGAHRTFNYQDTLIAQPPVLKALDNANGSQSILALDQGDLYPQGAGAPSAQGSGQAVPPTVQQPGPPMLPGSPGSRAVRNNNPGNLRGGGQWQGMTGTDPQGFVQFDNPQDGIRAAQINLANQTKLHGINTLQGLISKYAPPSDGNNVPSYVSRVAQQSGLDPNGTYDFSDPNVQAKILPAMFGVEAGGTPTQTPTPPPTLSGGSAPSGTTPAIGGRTLATSQGLDLNGPAMQASIDRDAQYYNQTGDLPQSPGRNAMPYQLAVKQRAAQRALQGLDADGSLAGSKANYDANKTALANITQDTLSTDANVQRAHEQAAFVMSALNGAGPTGSKWLNVPYQDLAKNGFGNTNVAKLEQALGTLTDDYGTVMGGGNAELTDQKQRLGEERINKAWGHGMLAEIVPQMLSEMDRAKAVKDNVYTYAASRYNNSGQSAVGTPSPTQLSSGKGLTSGNASPPRTGPVRVSSVADAMKLPPGTVFLTPDGRQKVR